MHINGADIEFFSVAILAIILVIGIFAVAFLSEYFATNWRSIFKKESKYNDTIETEKELMNPRHKVEYSNQVLEYIRNLVGQIAVLKFKAFRDSHDMDKITRPNVETLVADVANEVRNSLNMENVDLDNLLCTQEFLDKYIVDTSVMFIKDMLDEYINKEN